jgi:hypothetical protein
MPKSRVFENKLIYFFAIRILRIRVCFLFVHQIFFLRTIVGLAVILDFENSKFFQKMLQMQIHEKNLSVHTCIFYEFSKVRNGTILSKNLQNHKMPRLYI